MTTLYWALEYGKVFFAYMFIMFIWPSVIFRNYLRGKTIAFRFSFCSLVQVIIVNTVVLCLGLVKLLYGPVVLILFWGTFLFSILKEVHITRRRKAQFHHLIVGTYGRKTFFRDLMAKIGRTIRRWFLVFKEFMRGNWWTAILLGAVVIFGMIYFTYGAFQDFSYGFGDMYPHNAWIYGLVNGQIFSAGVYPEGMHCFLYAMHTLFGIRIYSCLLFCAGIHAGTLLISIYIFLRQIFRWHYTPVLALTAFLTVDVVCINGVFSMSRLQWTLPQEFGFYSLFLCGAYFVKYLKSERQFIWTKGKWKIKLKNLIPGKKGNQELPLLEKKKTKGYWDQNLLLFAMALAVSLVAHFYPTIMAFFVCIAFVPVMWKRIFNRKRFLPLVTAIVCGFLVAVIPMAGALASGIPFQGSIGWAMNVINGTDSETGETDEEEEDGSKENSPEEEDSQDTEVTPDSGDTEVTPDSENTDVTPDSEGYTPQYIEIEVENEDGEIEKITVELLPGGNIDTEPKEEITQEKVSVTTKIKNIITGIATSIKGKAQAIYKSAYVELYKEDRAQWIIGFTALGFVLWFLYRVAATIIRGVSGKSKVKPDYFDGYFVICLITVIYMVLYGAESIGLPALVAGARLFSIAQVFILAMMCVPLDMIFTGMAFAIHQGIMKAVSAICVAAIYVGTIMTGTFHGYLYYELTRHNAAVMTTLAITETLPKNTYTIVSPVDELYQQIQYGYHEELVNFINRASGEDYLIPTEYVFIYVEKKPLEYAQSHFFEGPDWLGQEKYAAYYNSYVSQCPDITVSEISEDLVKDHHTKYPLQSNVYSNLETRTIIESTAYAWCQEFKRLYPNELHTYYEDDNFVCYYFKQNTYNLYQLAIQ